MPPQKEFRGPSNFCEWVVGTTIPTILGPERKKKKKPTRRDVIKVEVTTDDESEADTLKITYPHSKTRRKKAASQYGTKVKKVRFEESPKKSALKKTTTKTYMLSESSEDADKTSDSSADPSSDSSASRIILVPEKNIKVHTVGVSDDSKTEESSDNESGASSDPSPTCKCTDCIRGRQKLARRGRKAALLALLSDSDDTSGCETDESDEGEKSSSSGKNKKKDQGKNKSKEKGKNEKKTEKAATVETESESESAKDDADDESSDSDKSEQQKKQKGKEKKEGKDQKEGKKGDKEKKKSDEKDKKKESSEGKKRDKKEKKDKSKSYPEANPGPDPRRPNLIEPIRAEVVQTERVIESQEDPPPNAYYDHEHNVLRVYHGPVYGGHHNHGLYPKRDSKNRPLPVGTAHPTQNPYFFGFNNPAAQPGQENAAPAQWPGMPWPGMPWPNSFPPVPGAPAAPPGNGSKGAFSDPAGRNNVAPAGASDGKPNPYYNKGGSPFQAYNKSNNSGSRKGSAAGYNNDGAPGSVKKASQNGGDAWGQPNDAAGSVKSSSQKDNNAWGSQTQDTAGGWDTGQTQQESQQPAEWDTTGNDQSAGNNTWGASGNTDDNNQNSDQAGGWPASSGSESNVMPGTFETGTVPWGDTSAAADTGGAIEREERAEAAAPSAGW